VRTSRAWAQVRLSLAKVRWIAIAWGLFILAILATVYLRIYQWIASLSLA